MRGYTHAVSGAAAWLAVTSTAPGALGAGDVEPSIVLLGTVLACGAGMLPDADHPDGTIAHAVPEVRILGVPIVPSITRGLCVIVNRVSGGHRHGTHSILGIAVITAICAAVSLIEVPIAGRQVPVGSAVLVFLLAAFAAKVLALTNSLGGVWNTWLGAWLFASVMTGAMLYLDDGSGWSSWLVLLIAVGSTVHCVGDMLTVGGVPWLWPWNPKPAKASRFIQRNGYISLPVLGTTDSKATAWSREGVLGMVLSVYVVYAALFSAASMFGIN